MNLWQSILTNHTAIHTGTSWKLKSQFSSCCQEQRDTVKVHTMTAGLERWLLLQDQDSILRTHTVAHNRL